MTAAKVGLEKSLADSQKEMMAVQKALLSIVFVSKAPIAWGSSLGTVMEKVGWAPGPQMATWLGPA
jgi:hypothetical protein